MGEYCKEKQSSYQKKGIQGRWQVTPDNLEPPHKRSKPSETELVDVQQMKVSIFITLPCFIYCCHRQV